VKIIKFTEENGNCTVKREFSISKAYTLLAQAKRMAVKGKCSVSIFLSPKIGNCFSA